MIQVEGSLRKETPASPRRAVGSRPKQSTSRHHSRYYIINTGELRLNMVGGLVWHGAVLSGSRI